MLTTTLRRLYRYLAAWRRHLTPPKPTWLPLTVLLGVPALAWFWPGERPDNLRYAGLLLQLLGIAVVAWGLAGRRRLFEKPSLLARLFGWWSQRPRFSPQPRSFDLTAAASEFVVVGGRLTGWRRTDGDATLEAQVDVLRANVETLKGELEAVARELRDEQRAQRDALASERTARQETVGDVRARVESLALGGLHVEWAGVWYLVLGVILATIPGEVVALLDWL